MKRILLNLIFTSSLILLILGVAKTFYGEFEKVLASEEELFPPEMAFPIAECQQWADEARDFHPEEGEYASRVAVLLYHRIISDEEITENHYNESGELYPTIVLESEFKQQMDYLQENNYTVLNSMELEQFLKSRMDVPENSIVITFDDGFKDTAVTAYPILKEKGFTAVNFLITSSITEIDQRYDSSASQYLSLADLKKTCDVFEFQSHTYNFHQLTKEGEAFLQAEPMSEARKDISASLVNLSDRNRSFAYPYGVYADRTDELLEELGFDMAFTTEQRAASPGEIMFKIPRIEVFPHTTLEEFRELIGK
ncbi:polysaccharide deacetylase family protein [Evansella sp. LMS18]|jgi:peptidoglycan/xylan/chitin deacetylase (PgdA/CDA1 family)|uniref:polysaccharide deacetylase family protein n=1 Tax=Evansella sp. LMS18 TaxID=2924033 RepID=UPI0020CFFD0B|nr:polysaccharide deacetylase family protein [Evansella sp. LMS18]UTR11883.1 polysaccharide deacetylase family protein [Evansella sp. LMS18]